MYITYYCKLFNHAILFLLLQGYVAEIPISASDKRCREYYVCTSCARAMRGRYKIQKLQSNVEFSCAMGEGNSINIR